MFVQYRNTGGGVDLGGNVDNELSVKNAEFESL